MKKRTEPQADHSNQTLEEAFEQYVEQIFKKIVANPQDYPFITILNGEQS